MYDFLRSSLFLVFFCLLSTLTPNLNPALADETLPPSARIVGGGNASPGEYPFMAAILVKGSGVPMNRQFCGGALIHPLWVLTAAHCIEGTSAASIRVGIGMHNLSTNTGQEIDVLRIIAHPNYDPSTFNNDVALLELSSPATLGTPIPIVSASTSLTGLTSTAIGWGTTSEGGFQSAILQEVDVPIVSNATCNASYGSITANMVCAGLAQGGKDACQGDSGGPLIIGGSGSPQLAGITSFGLGCARPDFYGVYARAAQYHSWIANFISFASEIEGPYGLWNGFINLVNIAELRNDSGVSVTAQVNILNINGELISTTNVAVPPGGQRDVILNQLGGFSQNSYGIVQISNNVSGRIFYYRPRGVGFSNFEFAFGIPTSEPMTGTRFVGFNTYQPSSNPFEQGNLVANWFSLVNLEQSSRTFTVIKYTASGAVISSQALVLGSRQRMDLDGGHVNPGPNNVGLIQIIPQDGSTEYLAQLIRYGYATGNTSFDFAFPLIPLPGESNNIVVPLGSAFAAQNWLEVINTANAQQDVAVSIFNSSGSLVHAETLSLSPFAQSHIFAGGFLGEGVTGQAVISPTVSRTVIAEGMFYFRDPSDGGIAAMYGSQAKQPTALATNGSYNLFLGMQNFLRIVNPGVSTVSVNIQVNSPASPGSNLNFNVPARGAIELPLHDASIFLTLPNTYGTVRVTPSGQVLSEILRVKLETNGLPQFAAPTELQ